MSTEPALCTLLPNKAQELTKSRRVRCITVVLAAAHAPRDRGPANSVLPSSPWPGPLQLSAHTVGQTPLFANSSIRYLRKLSDEAKKRHTLTKIRAAIDRDGFWEDHVEWRISTVTTLRIEFGGHAAAGESAAELLARRFEHLDAAKRARLLSLQTPYVVKVTCDGTFEARCPTLERAIEFLGIYEKLIQDLFWTVGWPSWAGPTQMEP